MTQESWIVRDYADLVRVFKTLRKRFQQQERGKPARPMLVSAEPWHKQRSLAQNRLYWWWLGLISEFYEDSHGKHFSDEDWHEYFKRKFLRARLRKVRRSKLKVQKSTTDLSVVQFSGYLTKIEQFCNDDLDFVLPRPEELYEAAVRGPLEKKKGAAEAAPDKPDVSDAGAAAAGADSPHPSEPSSPPSS